MGSALPHSSITAKQSEEYVSELQAEIVELSSKVSKFPEYRGLFKASTAAFSVLTACAHHEHPLLEAAATIVRRQPMLCLCAQTGSAQSDVRRFLELIIWYVYFVDHPIEWQVFLEQPTGYTRADDRPILYCARRNFQWYMDYARERFSKDASLACGPAIESLANGWKDCSRFVHAGVREKGSDLQPPFEMPTQATVRQFQSQCRDAFASGCLLLSAVYPPQLSSLTAVDRAWFDWLVGPTASKAIRSGEVGR